MISKVLQAFDAPDSNTSGGLGLGLSIVQFFGYDEHVGLDRIGLCISFTRHTVCVIWSLKLLCDIESKSFADSGDHLCGVEVCTSYSRITDDIYQMAFWF